MMDLNLLRIFDALMEHRSVTRAASRLGVTQPAVSHALARLRRSLGDPLFIRSQNGLQPTARAEEIAGGVRRGLAQFQNALAPTTFDPATAERRFTIAASSYYCALLIPALIERVRREAPGIALRMVPTNELLLSSLDKGLIDLAFGASALQAPGRIVVEPLYRETMVWIAAPTNAIASGAIAPEDIDDAARILIAPRGPFELGDNLEEIGAGPSAPSEWPPLAALHNRVTVYDSLTAVSLVARTDLIAQVPQRMAALATRRGQVVTLDWPREELSYAMALIWHARHRADSGLTWLRETIRRLDIGPENLAMPGGALPAPAAVL